MADIIHLLPDSVANQIAAGEVIQRPASVIKELVENSIDAGADKIKINIKDAGKTLIQVIDNGCGMSETDARMAFERHATSKITKAGDLFSIHTKGFRGEALASVAAIAHVVMKTRPHNEETGIEIAIEGSKVTGQDPVQCDPGTNIAVKNLFFNVPARRKFLKSDNTEFRHIIVEFQRAALSHPGIAFIVVHNNNEIYNLPPENTRQRIIHTIGRHINSSLTSLNTDTSIAGVKGYIGKPELAKKTFGEQFFFVNNRYMRHPYFHKAVMKAYDRILPPETVPSYFIFLDTDPGKIDVNIHPTKTEIKFEDEAAVFQVIMASVKEALGKFNLTPSIDFNSEGSINIPVTGRDTEVKPPVIDVDPHFNPFDKEKPGKVYRGHGHRAGRVEKDWEKLYEGFEDPLDHPDSFKITDENVQTRIESLVATFASHGYLQIKGKYILTTVKSGILLVDQKRAHERILFEKFMRQEQQQIQAAQKQLYPESIELDPADFNLLKDILDEINGIGFDISEFGKNSVIVNGCPSEITNSRPAELIDHILGEFKSTGGDIKITAREKIARSLACTAAIGYDKVFEEEEMRELIDKLFACENPNYSPSGKAILSIIELNELEHRFR